MTHAMYSDIACVMQTLCCMCHCKLCVARVSANFHNFWKNFLNFWKNFPNFWKKLSQFLKKISQFFQFTWKFRLAEKLLEEGPALEGLDDEVFAGAQHRVIEGLARLGAAPVQVPVQPNAKVTAKKTFY